MSRLLLWEDNFNLTIIFYKLLEVFFYLFLFWLLADLWDTRLTMLVKIYLLQDWTHTLTCITHLLTTGKSMTSIYCFTLKLLSFLQSGSYLLSFYLFQGRCWRVYGVHRGRKSWWLLHDWWGQSSCSRSARLFYYVWGGSSRPTVSIVKWIVADCGWSSCCGLWVVWWSWFVGGLVVVVCGWSGGRGLWVVRLSWFVGGLAGRCLWVVWWSWFAGGLSRCCYEWTDSS